MKPATAEVAGHADLAPGHNPFLPGLVIGGLFWLVVSFGATSPLEPAAIVPRSIVAQTSTNLVLECSSMITELPALESAVVSDR